MSHGSNR